MNPVDNKKLNAFLLRKINSEYFHLSVEDIQYVKKEFKINTSILADNIAQIIKNYKIPFPLKEEWMEDHKKLFNNLKNYRYNLVEDVPYYFEPKKYFKTDIVDGVFGNSYMFFVSSDNDYEPINILTNYFQEEAIIQCKKASFEYTPLNMWENINLLKELIKLVLNSKEDFTRYQLRETIADQKSECGLFKITIAKSVMEYFNSKKILDISSGWGDRLLAAISIEKDIEYYHGYDPKQDLFEGYNNIINTFAKNKQKFRMVNYPFEDVVLDSNYDLIFTSPPFFILEDYGFAKRKNANIGSVKTGQSVDKYPNLEDWIVKFLYVSLFKAWNKLIVGGFMVINIEDTHINRSNEHYLYTEPMILFANTYLKGSEFLGVISHVKSSKNPKKARPLYVWLKNEYDNENIEKTKEKFKKAYNIIYKMTIKVFENNIINLSHVEKTEENNPISITNIEDKSVNPLPDNYVKVFKTNDKNTTFKIMDLVGEKLSDYNAIIHKRIKNFKYEYIKYKKNKDIEDEQKVEELKKEKEYKKVNNITDDKGYDSDKEELYLNYEVTMEQLRKLNKKDLMDEADNQGIKYKKADNKETIASMIFDHIENGKNVIFLLPLIKIIENDINISKIEEDPTPYIPD